MGLRTKEVDDQRLSTCAHMLIVSAFRLFDNPVERKEKRWNFQNIVLVRCEARKLPPRDLAQWVWSCRTLTCMTRESEGLAENRA